MRIRNGRYKRTAECFFLTGRKQHGYAHSVACWDNGGWKAGCSIRDPIADSVITRQDLGGIIIIGRLW